MRLITSSSSSTPFFSPSFSLLFCSLLVSITFLSHAQAAPARDSISVSSDSRAGWANQAAQLSYAPKTSAKGYRLDTQSSAEQNDKSPWKESHRNALPRPNNFGKVNTTTVTHNQLITNVTTKAGKSMVKTKQLKAEIDANEPILLQAGRYGQVSATPTSTSKSATSTATPVTTDISCDDDGDDSSFPVVTQPKPTQTSCFPALNFKMPSGVPDSLDDWWCDPSDEYAFMGFSYAVDACQSQEQLTREFKDARKTFDARYVRIYSVCDQDGFYDRVINAAWEAGIGVQALVWFGFDGTDIYKTRRAKLFSALRSNPYSKYVVRAVQFGSEPLFDWAISGTDLATEVKKAKSSLKALSINVTVSEMAYGYQYQANTGSQDVLDSIDFIDAHMLPYFSQQASTGDKAWSINANDMKFFNSKAPGKKVYWSQTGWPSKFDCSAGICPNSKDAVADVKNEKAYFDLLDSKCTSLKAYPGGGVGWFAHLYSDNQGFGYGIYGYDGKPKFDFKPKTSC